MSLWFCYVASLCGYILLQFLVAIHVAFSCDYIIACRFIIFDSRHSAGNIFTVLLISTGCGISSLPAFMITDYTLRLVLGIPLHNQDKR